MITAINARKSYNTTVELQAGKVLHFSLYASIPFIADIVYLSGGSIEKEYMSMSAISSNGVFHYEGQYSEYKNQISHTFPIPKSGKYIITLRPLVRNVSGLVSGQIDVFDYDEENEITGKQQISLAYDEFCTDEYDLVVPADGILHKIFAKSSNPATSDLIMFVYGGYSYRKRVVGYNDDDTSGTYTKFKGTFKDSYIAISPHHETSHVRIINNGLNNAMATIYSDLLNNWPSTGTFNNNPSNERMNAPQISTLDLQVGSMCVFKDALVSDIYVSDTTGLIISEIHFNQPRESVSLSEIGITKAGTYIFSMVSDTKQVNSQQVRIK